MKGYLLIFLLFGNWCFAQSGFAIPAGEKKVVIPFQFINNLIFVNVEVNQVPLTFLLDTGVSQTLLLSLGNTDVDFRNKEKMKFSGLGGSLEIEGLKSRNNMVKLNDQYVDYAHTIYIILDENFNFSSYVGIPVHGIMGYDFFKNYPVEVDYINKKITIYNQDKIYKRRTKKFTELPISIENSKPYLIADVELTNNKMPSKLLLDLGNSDALWVFPAFIEEYINKRPHIDDFLGRGFNGDIFGKRSRIHHLYLGEFKFKKPPTAMPDEKSIEHVLFAKDRKGSVGSEIMRRFTVVLDYKNKKLRIRKNSNFNDPFRFNKSGLEFKHVGMKWDQEYVQVVKPLMVGETDVANSVGFTEYQYKLVLKPVFSVAGVRTGSPAQKAGLQKDDIVESVNGNSTSSISLPELNEMMRGEEGKNFKFEIYRGEVLYKYNFSLEDPIPYQE